MPADRFSVADLVVVVTGATRGIGRAVAGGFLAAGARVALVGRSESIGEQLGEDERGIAIRADVSLAEDRQRIFQQTQEQLGAIDVLVNNAGITRSGEGEYLEEDWDATLDVNLKAPFFLSQLVAQGMRDQQGGSIVNIGSIGARVGMPDNPAYQAAKGGLLQLTRAMARDWAGWNVRVNQVNPGYIHTEMSAASYADPEKRKERTERTMLGRWGTPDDLVGACLFLASAASSYMTGTDITVDGGWIAKGM
ncbi:MAG: glucose 1-dehydrogenase [Planctomycetota bacterium]|nr:glucose 1-dehydrogenase [Planctomycetota bacterium]MEE2989258.1 glucose 1-dehydrogenase [Planctomycetota bacterium]